jgi:type I restriction enzyme S subunit
MSSSVVTETRERITKLAVEKTKIPLVPKGTALLSFKLSLGKVAFAGTDLYTNEAIMAITPRSERIVQNDYLFYSLQSLDLLGQARQAVKGKTVNKNILQRMPIIVPPVPVQERIVQILRKADEIRQKRQLCISVLTKMTTPIFERFFGGVNDGGGKWPLATVESVLAEPPANGKSPSKKGTKREAEVLTLTAVRGGRLNLEHRKRAHFDTEDLERFFVRENDTYVVRGNGNIDLLGRMGLYDGPDEEAVFPDTMIRLRFNKDLVLNEFMAYLWDTQVIRRQIVTRAKTTSGAHKISQADILTFKFPLPPMDLQKRFLLTAERYFETLEVQRSSGDAEEALVSAFMSRAFTGELSADWEGANADWIAERVKLLEYMPRLLLLTLIRERVASSEKAVLVTALMKYAFLFQMEGNGHRRLYHFVPYHYGPFAKQLYDDLHGLVQEGVVRVENDQDEEKTRITLVNKEKADEMLVNMPEDVKADVAFIVETYGALDHRNLLKTVYKKYPAYAGKSKIKKKVREQ